MQVHGRSRIVFAAPALAAVLAVVLVAGHSALGQEPPPQEGSSRAGAPEEPRPFPRRGYGPGPSGRGYEPRGFESRGFELPTESTANKGFLFIDGEYLPGPYEIRYAENEVTINGRKLSCLPTRSYSGGRGFGYGYSGSGSAGPGMGGFGPPGFGSGRSIDPWRFMVNEVAQYLAGDSVVMSFAGQPLVAFSNSGSTYDLLKHLTRHDPEEGSNSRSISQVSFIQQLPDGFDADVWNEWIAEYVAPKNLVDRGQVLISTYDETEKQALAAIAARKRLDSWSYPLTVGLMVVTVLAVGHLLGGRPHANKPTTGIDDSPEMIQALNWSLIFVAVLSVGDLVLTILAGQAGQMRELNPLGSHLIHDTRHLFGFKVGATLPAIGLLWLLRRHKRAQVAAWWICLILVIVTFRWLTINSTFVAA